MKGERWEKKQNEIERRIKREVGGLKQPDNDIRGKRKKGNNNAEEEEED